MSVSARSLPQTLASFVLKGLLIGASCWILFAVCIYAALHTDIWYREYTLEKQGNEIRDRIEAYRHDHGQLPPDLTTLGITETEEGPIYYQKEDATNYILWFGMSLGESVTYSSKAQKWDD